jgi:hypothetical protein
MNKNEDDNQLRHLAPTKAQTPYPKLLSTPFQKEKAKT